MMRQRGRPRRSSMPAVVHNKLFDCPYSRQQQSPPEQYTPMQHYYNANGVGGGEEPAGAEPPAEAVDSGGEEDSRQLSDRYSRIQLVDHWPPPALAQPQQQFDSGTASGSSSSQQQQPQHYFNRDLDDQHFPAFDQNYLHYLQKHDDSQHSDDEDDEDDDEDEEEEEEEEEEEASMAGPSNMKRKRAFSFSSAPSASTTTALTTSMALNGPAGHGGAMGPVAEKRPATKICRVCGDKAYSYNFNVITCESCKAFFRRNANKEKDIRCPFNEQCDINVVSRRFCQRCRLQKCFRVGMKKEWIMSEEARLEKKQRIQENRERRAAAAAGGGEHGENHPTEMGDQQQTMAAMALQHHKQSDDATQLLAGGVGDMPMPITVSALFPTSAATAAEELQHQVQHHQETGHGLSNAAAAAIMLGQQQRAVAAAEAAIGVSAPLAAAAAVMPNPFVQPTAAVAVNAAAAPLLTAAVNNEQQAIAHQVAAAAAAQASAVQQAVNQAAAAVLLHHHQQQQQQSQQFQQQQPMDSAQQPLHEPSPPQQLPTTMVDDQPPVVGIPVASSTSIHTTLAGGGDMGGLSAPLNNFGINEMQMQQDSLQQQQQQQASNESAMSAAQAAADQQQQQSLLASAGLIPAAGQVHMMMTSSMTSTESTAPVVLAPAAAVAAALIQQQQNSSPQIMPNTAATAIATAAPHHPQQTANGPMLGNAAAATIQQQIASQVVAHQQAQQFAAEQFAAEQHHQQQQQQQVQHQQQQVAAAVAVAQIQAQQQAAQIVAHAQHMVHQQQQQLAALANAAVAHHHQQQQQTHQQHLPAAPLLACTVAGQQHPNGGPGPAEAMNQQLHQVASVLSAGSLNPSTNGSPAASGTAPPAGVLPFIEATAAHMTAAQPCSQPPAPPPIQPNSLPTAPAAILPALLPTAQQAAAAANLLIHQQQQQQQQMAIDAGQQHQQQQANNGTPPCQPASVGLPTPLVTGIPPHHQQQQQQQAGLSPSLLQAGGGQMQQQHLGQPMPTALPHQQPQQQQQSNAVAHRLQQQQQEMVSVPKDMLIKLVEQRLEAERNQLNQTPTKCQCRCQCGRYPNDMLIVDKVMADLLEGSSKHLDGQSSTNSTPRLSQQFQSGHFQQALNGQQQHNFGQSPAGGVPPVTTGTVPIPIHEVPMDTTSAAFGAAHQLCAGDQEQLAELSKAGEIWKNTASASSGELQFLMGHYTESDLRRLIAVAKALEAFKRLDQHDQERLLKGCFGSFFVLRSLLTVDASAHNLAKMRQSGVPECTLRFYAEFPAEWRQNDTVNLLLGMLLLFNVEVVGLQSAISVTVENMKFQSLLKRLLFVLCDRDSTTADAVNAELMGRLEQLKQLFPASSNNVGGGQQNAAAGISPSLPFGQPVGQQAMLASIAQIESGSVSSS